MIHEVHVLFETCGTIVPFHDMCRDFPVVVAYEEALPFILSVMAMVVNQAEEILECGLVVGLDFQYEILYLLAEQSEYECHVASI